MLLGIVIQCLGNYIIYLWNIINIVNIYFIGYYNIWLYIILLELFNVRVEIF